MRIPTKFITIFLLCFVCRSLSKPTSESDLLTTGRGIGSTLWGWVTYPFSWWSSESEQAPVNEQLIGSTTASPLDSIEVGKHNVTVWCNDQTCTTMKCDQFGCRNTTCNIYDTDLMGECREYNTASTPEEHSLKPTDPKPSPVEEKVTERPSAPGTTSAPVTTPKDIPSVEEHPLELEAILSSTVNRSTAKSPRDKIVTLNPGQRV